MNILVFVGSARKGNTSKMVKLVEARMQALGDVNFEYIHTHQLSLNMCKSCHVCFLKGEEKCQDSATVESIVAKLEQAEGLILASPVYSLQVSASMKNLIDHLSYLFHRPRFFDKKAMAIVTTAGGGHSSTLKYLASIPRYWGYNYTYKLGVRTLSIDYEIEDKIERKAKKVAESFYYDLKSKKLHPPGLYNLIFFNVWKALNFVEKDKTAADYRYWSETGLLQKNYHIKLNPVKNWISVLMNRIFVSMFRIK